ncbi:hypothetical protein CBR_g54947 [Chara braunii]|uniref:Uncharacterized protein n=1 Tax=Chara braunii TaxID=69332 RepID=A0A388K7E5_CHABU|nr:hypothetical protein CBR_g54947 [Chara braunii]|eukprot:GBG65968.1 hypothetical protein CBR_g54947 [Chara braunii]
MSRLGPLASTNGESLESKRCCSIDYVSQEPQDSAARKQQQGQKSHEAIEKEWRALRGADKPGHFGVTKEELCFLSSEHHLEGYRELNGALGLADLLKTDAEHGIKETDLEERKKAFGTNTHPRKPMKSFWVFVFETFEDLTLRILTVCAIASTIVGVLAKGKEEGWYDGVAISFAVLLVVITTSVSDYKQAIQFRNLNLEKDNIPIQVSRDYQRMKISIWDIVVGDIVHISTGDKIPADGVLVEGHSVLINESSMTGESKHVKKDVNEQPFLLAGCTVADGQGRMMVSGQAVSH